VIRPARAPDPTPGLGPLVSNMQLSLDQARPDDALPALVELRRRYDGRPGGDVRLSCPGGRPGARGLAAGSATTTRRARSPARDVEMAPSWGAPRPRRPTSRSRSAVLPRRSIPASSTAPRPAKRSPSTWHLEQADGTPVSDPASFTASHPRRPAAAAPARAATRSGPTAARAAIPRQRRLAVQLQDAQRLHRPVPHDEPHARRRQHARRQLPIHVTPQARRRRPPCRAHRPARTDSARLGIRSRTQLSVVLASGKSTT
jgi:hypothetical protein